MRHMVCPECGRIASVAEWCARPICVHAWDSYAPEIWDGDDSGSDGRPIEWSPNEEWRTPGPDTWAAMIDLRSLAPNCGTLAHLPSVSRGEA
jgi:hypothetical protein